MMHACGYCVAALFKSISSLVKVAKNTINLTFCSGFSEYTFRYKVNEGVGIPKIPVHPIGYHDAEVLLR